MPKTDIIQTDEPEISIAAAQKRKKGASNMKSTGIIRKVDELGRIVLPIELRRTLDIAERDELEIFMESDFKCAVEKAREISAPGDYVMLTPACASFGVFKDFEERGERFIEIVKSFEI